MTALRRKRGKAAVIGFILGAVCGILQLYLLSRVVKAVAAGKSGTMLLLLLLKFLVLAMALVPVIVLMRDQLLWCALGITATLIIGSGIIFFRNAISKGEKKS